MALHAFNPNTRKQRQVDFCVFKANLVYNEDTFCRTVVYTGQRDLLYRETFPQTSKQTKSTKLKQKS